MLDQNNRFLGLSIFAGISAPELTSMLECISGFTKTYEAGSYIISDGADIECIGVVLSGMVQIIKEDIWGERAILAMVEPAQIFGETYVFAGERKINVSFVATEDSEVLFLPYNRILHTCSKACSHHQRLVDNIVSLIAHKNLRLTDKLEITTKKSLRSKILTYLSQESHKKNSKYFTVPLGRIEMAEYLCADRSALTRELTRMRDEGIIDYSNNTFRLL